MAFRVGKGQDQSMTLSVRTATCETCSWTASGSSAWSQGDAHAAETGHTVRRAGLADPSAKPHPYTQPHSDPSAP